MFPGNILLEVFDFCRLKANETQDENFYDWWHGLVHVCRRWRQLIFTSPRRLKVQLHCTCDIPVKKKIDCWPQIPIAINLEGWGNLNSRQENNLLTAIEHSHRVCSITLNLPHQQLEKVVKMMLTHFSMIK